MFMHVTTGYFSTFKDINNRIFSVKVMSRSNKLIKMCVLLYTKNIYAKYKKVKPKYY